MATRFGDANENGNEEPFNQAGQLIDRPAKRRSTKFNPNGPTTPHHGFVFKAFTEDSLISIQERKTSTRSNGNKNAYLDPAKQKPEPDPYLASGQQLPPALVRQLPSELVGKPIEDIDPYYDDQETFVIISRGKELTRFSATKALYILGPFHPIRRLVLYILVNPIFNLLVILTILTNCILMTIQGSETIEKTEIIFTIVYTTEMGLKVLARGFIIDDFTYLRDPWNWLDFAVILMAYLTIVVEDLGNLSVIRTFRVLRALKTVAIIPGMKTIVGAVIDSVKNLKDVVVLTLFSLSVFSLLGLQIYMGQLTQKCISNGPTNMTNHQWQVWCGNSSHWIPEPDDGVFGAYRLCGNATGAQSCPTDYTCIQGFGPNPDYGYTNFDTFGWSLICSFRLMTQDNWEGIYMQILKTAGSWHIIFFIISIFLGSIYLMNLILAIVAMSYNELQRRALEEEEAAAEDEAAFLESCRLMEMQEQMSEFSTSTPGGGRTSYRPSIEIGLVGQSLLASLCQNGLLGQNVREKINQQMILPGMVSNNINNSSNIRSHSLSINLDRKHAGNQRDSASKRASMVPTNYHLQQPNYPPMTASSMTELRRKSSVRTNTSDSPTTMLAVVQQPSPSGSPIHRIYQPQVIVSQQQQQLQLRHYPKSRSKKHSPHHHVSSSAIMSQHSLTETTNQDGESVRRRSARSSTTSDRDLNILRQRAALIRIGDTLGKVSKSDVQSLDLPEKVDSVDMIGSGPDIMRANSCTSSAGRAHKSRSEMKSLSSTDSSGEMAAQQQHQNQYLSIDYLSQRAKSHDYSTYQRPPQDEAETENGDDREEKERRRSRRQVGSDRTKVCMDRISRFRSEAAICRQPASIHGHEHFAQHSANIADRYLSRKRPSILSTTSAEPHYSLDSSVANYRSGIEQPQAHLMRPPALNQEVANDSTVGTSSAHCLLPRLTDARQPANQPTLNDSVTTLNSVHASNQQQLSINRCLQPDQMHHLSVENFQQFGSIRLPHQTEQQPPSPEQTPLGLHQYSASENPAEQNQFIFHPRLSRGRLESRSHIHPTTMMRSSFARPRQSFAIGGANNAAGAGLGVGPSASGARRVSQDFVRRASDWSRLSMSGNVDLRRLLRLWSHTNPYQGRPSIGSCSNYSQAGFPNAYDSPGLSMRDFNQAGDVFSQNNSPRPSSVGSARQAYEMLSAVSRQRNRFQSDQRMYALPLDDNMSFDRMSVNYRDKCLAYCLSCLDILCIWECCGVWLKIQRLISIVVFDPFTELFIILCILINTLFMALDSDDTDAQMKNILERGNYFFTATFAVEASMKIMALSPKFYFREGWNVFDAIIVGLSLLELGLEGVYGLSVLRSFRLLRVFKLAKSWPTLNLLISIMGKAVGDLGNLTFVLAIIVFIFAVMGMQLFGNKYVGHNFPNGELPRWNFTDFMHSFMIVFRILCAEWIEPMWDCLLVGGWPCIPFFLIAVTVGNLVVLNLFLALLLASFGAANLSSPQAENVDTKKLQEAISRFSRFGHWIRKRIGRSIGWLVSVCFMRNKRKRDGINSINCDGLNSMSIHSDGSRGEKPIKSHIAAMSKLERLRNIELRTEELKSKIRRSPEHHHHLRQLAKSQLKESTREQPQPQQNLPASTKTGGFNFNYRKRKLPDSPGLSQQPQMMAMIPIIVDEAVENDTASSCGAEEPELEFGNNSNGARGVSNAIRIVPSANSADAGMLQEIGEFNESQISVAELYQQQQQQQQQKALAANKQSFGARHSIYSVNMQPIREDSRDADSSASLSDIDQVGSGYNGSSLDKLAQDEMSFQSMISRRLSNARWATIRSTSCEQPAEQVKSADDCKDGLATDPREEPDQVFASHQHHQDTVRRRSQGGEREEIDQQEPLLGTTQVTAEQIGEEPGSGAQLESRPPVDHCRPGQHEQRLGQSHDDLEQPNQGDEDEEMRPKSSLYLSAPKRQDMEEEDEKTLQHIETYIEKCICLGILCLKWFLFRQYVRKIVEHRYFDQCILVLIVISSGTLALEDKHLNERPNLKRTLDVLDTIFTIIFSLEMILKWLAFGFRRYFGNIWSWLDFVIVLVSFVNLCASIFGSGKIQALKTMRTLRAMRGLRPLRALQRFQGMRVVVNALIQAIPSIFNVLLVCLIFWLIFSIMGVQMFGGKFWRCLNPETHKVVTFEEAANRHECLERNLTWANPQINFDNVLNAYLALFQVATFEGWIDIMNSATDSRTRDDQPIREANIYMYFYFVFFVIFGSFFTLNLFIGVIIDNFNEQKRKTGGSLEIFMTEDQKKYYHAMKKMRSKRPIKAMTRPKLKLQAYMFDLTTSKKFDMVIMLIIGMNMLTMALEHYGQSQEFSVILENLNLIFIAIFTLECLCKIFAMRHFYFREPWNIFDFIVVDLSILGVVMKEYVAKYFVSPTLLRVVRVVKVGRVLRLVKGAKVMFIYAIFGMSFFMNVRKRAGIDETFNFETFTSSIIVLFQMSTSAAWDMVLDPLMDEENDCQKPDPALGIEGTCGNKGIAIAYLISYVIVTFLIIINMYIAVILENYSQATEDVQEGLTDDDYEMYYEIWQKFDPDGTQYLPYERLSDFIDALEDPLRIPKPNELALVMLDINIYVGNQCYCVDILDALTKHFFTRKGLVIQVNEHLQKVQSTLHETAFERITTTYLVKRQHYCARVIQNCWRKWIEHKRRSDELKLQASASSHQEQEQEQEEEQLTGVRKTSTSC